MDSAEFHAAVYDTVRTIPPCKVTSYEHIAKLIGMPKHSRHVGRALKFLSPNTNPPVPGIALLVRLGPSFSRGPGTQGAQRQRDALRLVAEGMDVKILRQTREKKHRDRRQE